MRRLIRFELGKVWRRRSFLLSVCVILIVNLFFLWYFNLPKESEAPLSAYRQLQSELSGMTEQEKGEYIGKLYEDMQGIVHVYHILMYEAFPDSEMGEAFAEQERKNHPGVFETYYPLYESGEYLRYTDSYDQELSFINEIYDEWEAVSEYPDYLESVWENRDTLAGISIFSSDTKGDFSSRNIEKSAKDYRRMENVSTSFFPSKGIVSVTQNPLSDLLLLLIVFLFVGSLVYEEKAKQLFFITRATKAGRGSSIGARILALGISCLIVASAVYAGNVIFYAGSAGLGDLSRSIQSVAAFREGCIPVSVWQYLLLTVFTKAMVLFVIGTVLLFLFLASRQVFLPYLIGAAMIGGSFLCYQYIPAASGANWLKYLNVTGLLKTENLYGSYLNFNFFGYPVSRTMISVIVLAASGFVGIMLAAATYRKGRHLTIHTGKSGIRIPFHPHAKLFRHESFKILIMNRAAIVLILFMLLLGYQDMREKYEIPPMEMYYQCLMLELEGELTPQKTDLIKTEKERYDEAFAEIDRIDEMIANGEIEERVGENRKIPYYNETAYYPAFERILEQYEHVWNTDGRFVYDTGYLYLSGIQNNRFLIILILLTFGLIFAYGDVFSMENQKQSWGLLSATQKGRRSISVCKVGICMLWTAVFYLISLICYMIPVIRTYPLHMLTTAVSDLPAYYESGMSMPILGWLLLMAGGQLLALEIVTLLVLLLSKRLGAHLQVLFTAVCLLAVPLFLCVMGIDVMSWCSIFPLFDCARILTQDTGMLTVAIYTATAAALGGLSLYDILSGREPLPLRRRIAAAAGHGKG